MKTALQIIQYISYSSNTEISKVSAWANVKQEALNGLNRAITVLWNSKEWNFRREIIESTVSEGENSIAMGDYILGQDSIRIDNTPLIYDKEIPFYNAVSGTPAKYYVTNTDEIILYPVPDKEYTLKCETFGVLPVLSSTYMPKTEFTAETDVINVPARLEKLFIDCLNYFCNEILNGDPTDEEYQEHTLRHAECYQLLEKADNSSLDNDTTKGFTMPWQRLS